MATTISAALVKTLRDRTGAGMMEWKTALVDASGALEKATTPLRKRGLVHAAKRAGRATSQGVVGSYIHMGGKVGVLVEVNCETDFVARTDGFLALVKDVAMQIAASHPPRKGARDPPGPVRRLRQASGRDRQNRRGQARRLLRPDGAARTALHPRPVADGRTARRRCHGEDRREHHGLPL